MTALEPARQEVEAKCRAEASWSPTTTPQSGPCSTKRLSRAGYEVRSTGTAATLWRWVSQGEGDLVITDVIMPDENAFDLLPRISKRGRICRSSS